MFLLEHATYVHREAPRYTASDLEAAWKNVKGHGVSKHVAQRLDARQAATAADGPG